MTPSPTAPLAEIEVVDRTTGEVLEVRGASEEQLAKFCANLAQLRGELATAEAVVHAELLRRLDRSGKWTHRIGEPTEEVQWEVKAPSPRAGATKIDADPLERELRALVEGDDIDPAAAEAALERTVTVTFALPWDQEPQELIDKALQDERVTSAEPARRVRDAGVKALEKISGKGARAVARATVPTSPPKRKPTVKPITKKGTR